VAERPDRLSGKRIFDFLRSRGARCACPLCGHEHWTGWDERILLVDAAVRGNVSADRQAIPLTCANCGFVRLQSAHVLGDPRGGDDTQ
jgi:hypothetical protein